jgi:hypothetical protein
MGNSSGAPVSITESFIGLVMRLHGGRSSTLILFQLRSGSASTRGSITTNWRQQASRRRRLRKRRFLVCAERSHRPQRELAPKLDLNGVPRRAATCSKASLYPLIPSP